MKISRFHFIILAGVVAVITANASCRKINTLTNGGIITFSTDTLKFDTVFTKAGSFTNQILIYNPQNEAVVLSSVVLQNGAASYFHLNIDGLTGNTATNIKIAPHDSIYVFATVNIDPNNVNSPFLITDALVATMNGKAFTVPFTAYGQNAHYIIDSILSKSDTWTTTLPYVIIWTGDTTKPRGLQINPGLTLNIPHGCRIYMHQTANIAVFGVLNTGTPNNPDSVIFQGDRLDRAYFGYIGYPGEWGGLYFDGSSHGSTLTNTIIKNCGNGALGLAAAAAIYLAYDTIGDITHPQIALNNCTIENSYAYGIYSYHGTVAATNCNINTTGQQALAILLGGTDLFTNCTFANYGTANVAHASAGSVAILDYYWDGVTGDPVYFANLNAVMRNCIVYGSLDSEVVFDTTGSPAGTQANLLMDHCLLKMGSVREPFVTFTSCLFNQDPLFKNSANGDFTLMSNSPAINSGTSIGAPGANILGVNWGGTTIPDIGCY
jgi:hypothetical protein